MRYLLHGRKLVLTWDTSCAYREAHPDCLSGDVERRVFRRPNGARPNAVEVLTQR